MESAAGGAVAADLGRRGQGRRALRQPSPAEWAARLDGYRQRANWAQQNAWEALPTYLAAVAAAWWMKVPVAEMNAAAGVFALARVAHGLLYVADKAALRSLAWLVGLLAVLYLFLRAGGVIAL
ncbi:MAPEG family [Chromobacterium violaceum]|uniref:MAPEG family n=1 Tax=Chromobacterium violaceum TaxID=536 RepID=A0A447TAA4_CHRVL|nr:MAPEG family [Chromobacterium violaceum]